MNLESRAFLHSYDYRLDPKGRLLETILSSPMVVGMNKCLHRLGVRRTTMMPDRLLQKRHPQNHPHRQNIR